MSIVTDDQPASTHDDPLADLVGDLNRLAIDFAVVAAGDLGACEECRPVEAACDATIRIEYRLTAGGFTFWLNVDNFCLGGALRAIRRQGGIDIRLVVAVSAAVYARYAEAVPAGAVFAEVA